jgi:hypothetical protein
VSDNRSIYPLAESLSRRTRLLLFLYGGRNVVGSLLALGGLGLYFVGLIDSFWPLIVGGLYGIGYLATPASPKLELSIGQSLDAGAIEDALKELTRKAERVLEPDVMVLVSSIVESIRAILPRLTKAVVGDRSLFDVRQTALDYLPGTLERYAALPRAYRRLHNLSGGQTPHDLLTTQLTLLDTKMKEIVSSALEGDTAALQANGRFLQERFGADAFQLGPAKPS